MNIWRCGTQLKLNWIVHVFMNSKDAFLVAIVMFVILTWICFCIIQYVNYNSKATNWNRMNLLGAITLALTLNSIIPQLFSVGRTEAQCRFQHHWAGSFYVLTNGLVRLFFQCRSNQIAPDTPQDNRFGNIMAGIIIFITILGIILNNITMKTFIVPPLNICIPVADPMTSLVFVLLFPMLIDTAINVRFFKHIFRSTQQMSGAAAKSHGKAPIRLLRVTCILSFSCMAMSFICTMIVFGFIPIQDPTWATVVLALEQSYNACSVAWPAIYISLRKRVKSYLKQVHTQSPAITANTNLSKTNPKSHDLDVDSVQAQAMVQPELSRQ